MKKLIIAFIAQSLLCLSITSNGQSRQTKERVLPAGFAAGSPSFTSGLVKNGWYQQNGRIIWGFYHNSSFWGGLRKDQKWYSLAKVEGPNITRRDPERIGPLLTENLDSLSSSLKEYGFPGLIHHYGLWYDRRRDAHDLGNRNDTNVVTPFLEMPWARSNNGRAADGLHKYDLSRFNPWYFERLAQFAQLCDEKGLIFFFSFYQQHMLLEARTHYEDFPWRPCNNIQNISLPDTNPAANAFYSISTPLQQKLHRLYIKKCLDELGHFHHVVFSLSQEYTGPRHFVEFWLDVVKEWENENNQKVHLSIGATKDVTEAILAEPERADMIETIDMSRWWYDRDGTLFAPPGGMEIPGRFMWRSSNTSPEQIYRLISEYRMRYPSRALLHSFSASHQQVWAFLIAGGSMLRTSFDYPDAKPPQEPYTPPASYIPPAKWPLIKPTYEFINTYLGTSLPRMMPNRYVLSGSGDVWALSDADREYLVYTLHGDPINFELPKTTETFVARWFDPRSGLICQMKDPIMTGKRTTIAPPDGDGPGLDWVLWLVRQPANKQKPENQDVFQECKTTKQVITSDVVRQEVTSPECFRHNIGGMLKFNFQPSGIQPPDGYFEDNGDIFGERYGMRFGWLTDHSDRMKYKSQIEPPQHAPDMRLETVCDAKAESVWEIEVENGDYLVELTAGDPQYPSYCTAGVEGVTFWDTKTLYTDEFATLEKRVTVADGRLTIAAQGGNSIPPNFAQLR